MTNFPLSYRIHDRALPGWVWLHDQPLDATSCCCWDLGGEFA